MEADVVNLGKEINRLERQAALDLELSKATSTAIRNIPNGNLNGETKTGRATDEYKKAFWKAMKNKNSLEDRKSTRLNSSHANISYAVFCLKKKKTKTHIIHLS